MINLLLKYNFIDVLPLNKTYYYISNIPANIKLTDELLHLNYSKFSPYKNSKILSKSLNEKLMLWFYEPYEEKKIVIPEGYLLFLELNKNKKNAIYIIENEIYHILAIKDNSLINSFSSKKISDYALASIIEENNINEIVKISKEEYKEIYKNSLNKLTYSELLQWNNLQVDKSFFIRKIEENTYSILFLFILLIGSSYLHTLYLENNVKELKKEYLLLKEKNEPIKNEIIKYNQKVKKLEKFIDKELSFPSIDFILKEIYNSIDEVKSENTILKSIHIVEEKVKIQVETELNPTIFLNKLNNKSEFSHVFIINTHKPKKAKPIITYEIILSPQKAL